jgi:hypothetical protein
MLSYKFYLNLLSEDGLSLEEAAEIEATGGLGPFGSGHWLFGVPY